MYNQNTELMPETEKKINWDFQPGWTEKNLLVMGILVCVMGVILIILAIFFLSLIPNSSQSVLWWLGILGVVLWIPGLITIGFATDNRDQRIKWEKLHYNDQDSSS